MCLQWWSPPCYVLQGPATCICAVQDGGGQNEILQLKGGTSHDKLLILSDPFYRIPVSQCGHPQTWLQKKERQSTQILDAAEHVLLCFYDTHTEKKRQEKKCR